MTRAAVETLETLETGRACATVSVCGQVDTRLVQGSSIEGAV